ncbi:MAG: hypothetical protein CR967_01985 [Proteobacteria bacterium]|nr:MAG: hypothetical protein CR967_01985 [Pseudomonadota bacterium]
MSKKHYILYSIIFASLIVLSNYTVQFQINEWLTYGAIAYPFTYLFSDILSENNSKKETLRVVQLGAILAIIPTLFLADFRIALGSISAFFLIQQLDVHIFHALKKRFSSLWWLRNNGSTLVSQFFDSLVFWVVAFAGVMPTPVLIKLFIGDYLFKVVAALLDTPFFYAFAIKMQLNRVQKIS